MKDILEEILSDKGRLYAFGTAVCFGVAFSSLLAFLATFLVLRFILAVMREE